MVSFPPRFYVTTTLEAPWLVGRWEVDVLGSEVAEICDSWGLWSQYTTFYGEEHSLKVLVPGGCAWWLCLVAVPLVDVPGGCAWCLVAVLGGCAWWAAGSSRQMAQALHQPSTDGTEASITQSGHPNTLSLYSASTNNYSLN